MILKIKLSIDLMFANYTLNFKKIKGLDPPPGPRPPGLTPPVPRPEG